MEGGLSHNPRLMRKVMVSAVVFFAGIIAVFTTAKAEGLEVSLDVTYAERYIWRGIPLNQESVLQPSLTVGNGGFYINVWSNVDLTDWGDHGYIGYGDESGRPTEIDFSAGYEASLDRMNIGFGFSNYTLPHQKEIGSVATTEIYASLAVDAPLSPSLSVYVDEDIAEGAVYTAFDIGHSFDLWESGEALIALDLSGHLGHANHKFIKTYYIKDNGNIIKIEDTFHDWGAMVALPISLGKGVSVTPAYSYSSIMNDRLREFYGDKGDHMNGQIGFDKEVGIFTLTLSLCGKV